MNDLVIVDGDKAVLEGQMVDSLIKLEKEIKELKSIEETYKTAIKTAMEEKGVLKITDETVGLCIQYIEGKENLERFNADKFREDNPDLYDEYVTMDGKKSAYITIRIK